VRLKHNCPLPSSPNARKVWLKGRKPPNQIGWVRTVWLKKNRIMCPTLQIIKRCRWRYVFDVFWLCFWMDLKCWTKAVCEQCGLDLCRPCSGDVWSPIKIKSQCWQRGDSVRPTTREILRFLRFWEDEKGGLRIDLWIVWLKKQFMLLKSAVRLILRRKLWITLIGQHAYTAP
jgi:hypothetical protein